MKLYTNTKPLCRKRIVIADDKMVAFIPAIELQDKVTHKILKQPNQVIIKDTTCKSFNSIPL